MPSLTGQLRLRRQSLRGALVALAFGPIAALLCAACASMAPTYAVMVLARSTQATAPTASFAVVTGNASGAVDAKLAERVNGIVSAGLARAGMKAVRREVADVLITIDYSIASAGSVRERTSAPIWRRVPGQPVTRTEFVGTTADGKPIYQTITEPGEPTLVYDGERVGCGTRTIYEKRVRLAAHGRLGPSGFIGEYRWSVDVSTRDQGSQLSAYVPALAAAAVRLVNQDSGGRVSMPVHADGKPVEDTKSQPAPRRDGC